jgi:hypothetical protein
LSNEKNELIKLPEFKGNDLVPLNYLGTSNDEDMDDELVGRENCDMSDFSIPSLALLQPQSPAVAEGLEDAKPGRFILTSTDEVIEGPIRAIAILHNKSRKLTGKDAEEADAKECRSYDAVEGTEHGICEDCPYAQWSPSGQRPACALSNDITLALEGYGPAKMRFRRSSFPSGKSFVNNFLMSRKNLWHHPVLISSTGPHDGKNNSKYFKMKITWDRSTVIPKEFRAQAEVLYKEISAAFEQGRLNEDDVD